MANWHSSYLELYLSLKRDTVRVQKFLTDYFNDPVNHQRYNAWRYIELADRLGTISSFESLPNHLDKSLSSIINLVISSVYNDSQSSYDGFGLLTSLSLSQTVAHKVPYLLKYLQQNPDFMNNIYALNKLGHYPGRSEPSNAESGIVNIIQYESGMALVLLITPWSLLLSSMLTIHCTQLIQSYHS